MQNNNEINPKTFKTEVRLVNTIKSESSRTYHSDGGPKSGVRMSSGGDGIDWKKKYKEELDKRFEIEEQNDDLQTQVYIIRYPNQTYCMLHTVVVVLSILG